MKRAEMINSNYFSGKKHKETFNEHQSDVEKIVKSTWKPSGSIKDDLHKKSSKSLIHETVQRKNRKVKFWNAQSSSAIQTNLKNLVSDMQNEMDKVQSASQFHQQTKYMPEKPMISELQATYFNEAHGDYGQTGINNPKFFDSITASNTSPDTNIQFETKEAEKNFARKTNSSVPV